MNENETITHDTFWRHLNEAKKEIKAVLVVDDDKHREEAREIAVLTIRKLLGFLPNMVYREQVALGLLGLVNWQGRQIIPEVLDTMNIVFGGNLPKSVSVYMRNLEQINDDFLLKREEKLYPKVYSGNGAFLKCIIKVRDIVVLAIRKLFSFLPNRNYSLVKHEEKRYPKVCSRNRNGAFFKRIAKAQEGISRVLAGGHTEEARVIAASTVHELLPELPTMGLTVRVHLIMTLFKLVSWEDRELVAEMSEAIRVAYQGDIPKCVAKKLADLRYDTGAL